MPMEPGLDHEIKVQNYFFSNNICVIPKSLVRLAIGNFVSEHVESY